MLIGLIPATVYAASAVNVSISSAETQLGQEVDVTITLSGNDETIAVTDLWITYDPVVLEAVSGFDNGGGGKVRIISTEGKTSYTLKFKAVAVGSSEVKLNTDQCIISTLQTDKLEMYVSTGTVTVKGATNLSKNNSLSSLVVTPGTLVPAFSKDVTTYNMTLDEYCARLTVSAVPEDSKAKISIWGAAMDPGDNTTKITVTAENGDEKVYIIYTKVPDKKEEETKKEETELIVEIDGRLYNVVNNFDESLLPEGYEVKDYNYKNNKIVVGKGLSNGKIIFCVTSADVEKAEPQFVVYDEQTGSFSELRIITTAGASYTVVEDETIMSTVEIPAGFVESEYSFNNITYKVWIEEGNPNAESFLIYCTNINGETGWYQFDMMESTMQRAFLIENAVEKETEAVTAEQETESENQDSEELTDLKQEYDDYVKKTKLAMILMAVLLLAIVIVVVAFAIKSFRDPYDDDDDDEAYRQAVSNVENKSRDTQKKEKVKPKKVKEVEEYEEFEEDAEEEEDDSDDDNDDEDITFLS